MDKLLKVQREEKISATLPIKRKIKNKNKKHHKYFA
jgi:hypothetical protein